MTLPSHLAKKKHVKVEAKKEPGHSSLPKPFPTASWITEPDVKVKAECGVVSNDTIPWETPARHLNGRRGAPTDASQPHLHIGVEMAQVHSHHHHHLLACPATAPIPSCPVSYPAPAPCPPTASSASLMLWYKTSGDHCRQQPAHLVCGDRGDDEESKKKPGKITRASLCRHYPDQDQD